MLDLNSLATFVKVVDTASFSAAARQLGMPISTVSRKVAELEKQLGARLLERSTRRLRLTHTGTEILEEARKSLEISENVESIIARQNTETRGMLRLSAPPSIAESVLTPLVTEFQKSCPQVRVHILVTERFVDHIAEGIDLAFRVGVLKDSSLVAIKLLRYRHQLVASPAYMDTIKAPKKPPDLLRCRLLAFSQWAPQTDWVFSKGARNERITFKPHLAMNDFSGLASSLASAAGIGDLPPIVSPHLLRQNKLVEVMPSWRFQAVDLSVVHLSNRYISRPVSQFKEFVTDMVSTLFDQLPA